MAFDPPTHYIRGAPRGTNYKRLLNLAAEVCDEFSLNRTQDVIDEAGLEFERRLRRFLLRTVKSMEWPGTRMTAGEGVDVSFYAVNDESIGMLAEVNGLYSFRTPHFPEDLSFYRRRLPWLGATAHERQASLWLTDAEARRINKVAPLLMVRRFKPSTTEKNKTGG